jgi:hypothetical protein
MRVMTGRAAVFPGLVDFLFENVLLLVTVQAELLCFRDEEKLVPGAVRTVAHDAAARGGGAMQVPCGGIQGMAIEAEVLHRQDELVCLPQMAALAKLRGIWSVFRIAVRDFVFGLGGNGPAGAGAGRSVTRFHPRRRRHAVEEKAQHAVAGRGLTPESARQEERRNAEYCQSRFHEYL